MPIVKALDAQALYRSCDPSLLPFQTTAELDATTEIVGQARAVEAVQFAIDMQRPGYNVFVFGVPGSGRHSVVRRLLQGGHGIGFPFARQRQDAEIRAQAAPFAEACADRFGVDGLEVGPQNGAHRASAVCWISRSTTRNSAGMSMGLVR